MKKELEPFAERLKALRIEKGLTQSEMGEFLGCSLRNYHRLEHGGINVPATTLMILADYFEVTVDYLLGRSGDAMKDERLVAFGKKLKELRTFSGKTQKTMGELLDCTVSNYQKIEYGEINIPITSLMILADYFGVTTDYLLGQSEERER